MIFIMVNKTQRFEFERFKRIHMASLVTCLQALTGRDYSFLANYVLSLLEKNTKHHGIIYSTKYLKTLYNFGVRYALQYPVKDIDPVPYRRVTKDGFPKDLRPFRFLLGHKNRLVRRCALSILNLHEGVEGPTTFNIETVTRVSDISQSHLRSIFRELKHPLIARRLRIGRLDDEDIIGPDSLFVSSKSGPNGKALEKAHVDALALVRDPPLFERVVRLLKFDYRTIPVGLDPPYEPFMEYQIPQTPSRFKDTYTYVSFLFALEARSMQSFPFFSRGWIHREPRYLEEFLNKKHEMKDSVKDYVIRYIISVNALYTNRTRLNDEFNKGYSHSVLRFLPAKSAKTRTVALVDYWSQFALRPVHKLFFSILKNLSGTDATFDHNSAAEKLAHWVSSGVRVWSYDLTAATDLFPSVVSKELISVLYGKELAEAWHDVISNRDFNISGRRGHTIRYGTGQPMGALSSWPVFAVTHHAIVLLAALRAGLTDGFLGYVIIGDDIVIANENVAEEYYNLMVNELKCEISLGKSIISAPFVTRGEVAKRIFIGNDEITPLSCGACKEVIGEMKIKGGLKERILVSKFKFLPTFLRMLHSRGWFKQLPRPATLAKGEVVLFLVLAFGRNIRQKRINRNSTPRSYYERVTRFLSIPGVLPAELLKYFGLEKTLWRLVGNESDRFRMELAIFAIDREKALKRIYSDKMASSHRLKFFINKYSTDVSHLFDNRIGSTISEHPLLTVYQKDIKNFSQKLTSLQEGDVFKDYLSGETRGTILAPFDAQYVSDMFKLVNTQDVLFLLTLFNSLKIERSSQMRYFNLEEVNEFAKWHKERFANAQDSGLPDTGLAYRCGDQPPIDDSD